MQTNIRIVFIILHILSLEKGLSHSINEMVFKQHLRIYGNCYSNAMDTKQSSVRNGFTAQIAILLENKKDHSGSNTHKAA